MNSLSRPVVFGAILLFVGHLAWAKGVTVRITVNGPSLEEPLQITDPGVVREFSIWSGPNSRWRFRAGTTKTDYSRIYIDFPGGIVDAPEDTLYFNVEFHIARTPADEPDTATYKVRYAINPARAGGYFYLPNGNPFIHHGVEDNWFRSTESWENLVRPIIEGAISN